MQGNHFRIGLVFAAVSVVSLVQHWASFFLQVCKQPKDPPIAKKKKNDGIIFHYYKFIEEALNMLVNAQLGSLLSVFLAEMTRRLRCFKQ